MLKDCDLFEICLYAVEVTAKNLQFKINPVLNSESVSVGKWDKKFTGCKNCIVYSIPRTSDCPEKYVAYVDLYREGPAEIHCLRGKI